MKLEEAIKNADAKEISELFKPLGFEGVDSFPSLLEAVKKQAEQLAEGTKALEEKAAEDKTKKITESAEALKKAGVKLEEKVDDWKAIVHSMLEGDDKGRFLGLLADNPAGSTRTGEGDDKGKNSKELTEGEREELTVAREEMS